MYDRDAGFGSSVGLTCKPRLSHIASLQKGGGLEEGILRRWSSAGLLDWTPTKLRKDWRQNATVGWEEVSLRCFLVSDLYHPIFSFLSISFFNSQGCCIIVLRAGADGVRDAYILVPPCSSSS